MRRIDNRIAECSSNNRRPLHRENLRYVMVHRQSLAALGIPDDDLDGPMLVEVFKDPIYRTGGLTPYQILVLPDGVIEQILPLSIRGAHARAYNGRALAVAAIGNTDKRPMSAEQYASLVWVCQVLMTYADSALLVGHTDVPGATRDPSKRCPGRYLSISQLEIDIRSPAIAEQAGFMV